MEFKQIPLIPGSPPLDSTLSKTVPWNALESSSYSPSPRKPLKAISPHRVIENVSKSPKSSLSTSTDYSNLTVSHL